MTKPVHNSATRTPRTGRKTTFTPELGAKVCEMIANGMSLKSIGETRGMPASSTIIPWLAKGERGDERYSDFTLQYAHARVASGDAAFEDIRDYERRLQLPRLTESLVDGHKVMVPTPGYLDANVGRTLIDSAKWRAAKLKPQVYGDRLELAGKVSTEPLVNQAPAWLQQAIKDKTAEVAAERATQDDEVPESDATVH